MSRRNRPHRDIIEDLESQGKPLDAVFLAWGIVEMNASSALFRGLLDSTGKKPNMERIQNHTKISSKLRSLKAMGYLSQSEFDDISTFKIRRDKLAHTDGIFSPNYREEEWTELVDMATKAADAAHAMLNRAMSGKRLPATESSQGEKST